MNQADISIKIEFLPNIPSESHILDLSSDQNTTMKAHLNRFEIWHFWQAASISIMWCEYLEPIENFG